MTKKNMDLRATAMSARTSDMSIWLLMDLPASMIAAIVVPLLDKKPAKEITDIYDLATSPEMDD